LKVKDGRMRIGELAKKSSVSTSRIRFYEAQKLLPKPTRGTNGYREYPGAAVETLRIIVDSQRLGFSLSEIRSGLSESAPRLPSRKAMLEALQCKLIDLDAHISEAKSRRREVVRLLKELGGCSE
jgi:DNA-binding transcriptional MerR regulator